jgi:hypothetical protein
MRNLPSSIGVVESEELRRQRNRGELKSVRTGRRWLLMPEGLMPKGRRELELGLQPMVERPSFRFALLLPDVIGAHCDFIVGCFSMSVGHKVFGGVGTSARYCDIVILREIFLRAELKRRRVHLFEFRPSVLRLQSKVSDD